MGHPINSEIISCEESHNLLFLFADMSHVYLDQKSRPSVLVLELEISALRFVNLDFYRTSSQQIKVGHF